jgi:hypothetical protein
MALEFDPRCSTAQPEDTLEVSISLDALPQDSNTTASQWPVFRKFSGKSGWPPNALVLPGNSVSFTLQTASDYVKGVNSTVRRTMFKINITNQHYYLIITKTTHYALRGRPAPGRPMAGRPQDVSLRPHNDLLITIHPASHLTRPVREGVSTDSLKFHADPPCPTLIRPAGGPPPKRPNGRLLPPWIPLPVRACP